MTRKLLLVAILLVACTTWAEKRPAKAPDFSGMWVLDPVQSHGDSIPRNTTVIVIRQSGNQLIFEYYRTRETDREPIAAEVFTLDGRSTKRYSSRTQVAYAKARLDKDPHDLDAVETRIVCDCIELPRFLQRSSSSRHHL